MGADAISALDDERWGFMGEARVSGRRVIAHGAAERADACGCATRTGVFASVFATMVSWLNRALNEQYLVLEAEGLEHGGHARAL